MNGFAKMSLRPIIGAIAAILLVLSVANLEGFRAGIARVEMVAGASPATLYQKPDAQGPLVVIAHGFAGSRQLMEAFSLTLARDGFRVLAYDLQGHGANRSPMGGDVAVIEGTTARLVTELLGVIEAGRNATGWDGPVGLVGHSMASDVVIRAGLAGQGAGPIVAVSMFSGAVTALVPPNLLIVSGEWEARLRQEALRVLRLTDPDALEGQTAQSADVARRAVVAPRTEHVSVLYSPTTLRETRDWLNAFYQRPGDGGAIAATGGWIALMLGAIPALGWALAGLLPDRGMARPVAPAPFLMCSLAIPLVVPFVATQVRLSFLPVLVADYVAVHLALLGGAQIAVLWWLGVRAGPMRWLPFFALLAFGLVGFGLALDRYVASFLPVGARFAVMAVMALGTVPFMLADAMLTEAGHAPVWRRLLLRTAFLGSLALAVALDFERLMFLVIIFPVIILFFVIFGSMGRWVALRSGAMPVGLALGLILAWSLGASFPLFER